MRCKHCSQEKPAEGFYTSNRVKCKDCVKDAVNAHRQANLEQVRAYDRMRGSMPHRVAARKEYQQTPAFAKSHEAASKRWANKHPERRQASYAVANAIRDGKLKKTHCHVCGCAQVEGHHPDYSRPLEVVWLCPPHHKQAHALVANESSIKERA
jgi:hypothetical protein